MRQHLDETLINAVLADWKAEKVTALQVAEFFAKHALPQQGETLNAEQAKEGRAMLNRIMGRMYEALRSAGVESTIIKAAYEAATKDEES